uniref:C-type lectin domain-containing protein n=1 Tax=Amphiprion ocellaris TaxID=80972 RepID=A0AAQ5XMG5_AMPOC
MVVVTVFVDVSPVFVVFLHLLSVIFHLYVIVLQHFQLFCISDINSSIFLSVMSPDIVLCHGLASGQRPSHYFLVQQPMSWITARKFCQRHYVDLAVLSTQEQYFTLLNATAANKVSFWLGLQRQSVFSDWKWVNGEELRYQHWFRRNYEGRCAILDGVHSEAGNLYNKYGLSHIYTSYFPPLFVCNKLV